MPHPDVIMSSRFLRLANAVLLLACLAAALTVAGCRRSPYGPPAHAPAAPAAAPTANRDYAWPKQARGNDSLVRRFPAPRGFTRVALAEGTWGDWLRHLPLLPPGSPVASHQGDEILPGDSPSLGAVVDLDVRPHQECADVIFRLRAEYLRRAGREDEITFPLGRQVPLSWTRWQRAHRSAGSSRDSLDRFLGLVFRRCGTYTLAEMGQPVRAAGIQVGDFFVHPGSPGHAVLIIDLARDDSGKLKALLLQGYMPAQSAHLLMTRGSAWFDLDPARPLDIPRWGAFRWSELRRFAPRAASD